LERIISIKLNPNKQVPNPKQNPISKNLMTKIPFTFLLSPEGRED